MPLIFYVGTCQAGTLLFTPVTPHLREPRTHC